MVCGVNVVASEGGVERVDAPFQLLNPPFDVVSHAVATDDVGSPVFGENRAVAGSVCH